MENQVDHIPEQWWVIHQESIVEEAKGFAERVFSSIAHELNWPKMLDGEEDFVELMKELEPRFNMTADELIDELIETARTEATFNVFREKYGHLCLKDESGGVLIPVRCIPELHGKTEQEIESRIEKLLEEHPGTVFHIPDPKTETIN